MSMDIPTKPEFQPYILVISGGGPKGMSFVGVLDTLQNYTTFCIKKLKILSGSSIGGVICVAICLGYTVEEIKKWFLSTDFTSLCPALYDSSYYYKILPLLSKTYSLSTGVEIKDILIRTFIYKKCDPNITFKELYEKTGKCLILTGSNILSRQCEYFSHEKFPDMKVLTALLITTRIPYVFPHIEYNQSLYVDGHLFDPFPIKGCGRSNIKQNKGKILGIISCSTNNNKNIKNIENIKDFTFSIIEGLSFQYMKKSLSKYKKCVIQVELDKDFFNLKATKEEMIEMFKTGNLASLSYLKKYKVILPTLNIHKA